MFSQTIGEGVLGNTLFSVFSDAFLRIPISDCEAREAKNLGFRKFKNNCSLLSYAEHYVQKEVIELIELQKRADVSPEIRVYYEEIGEVVTLHFCSIITGPNGGSVKYSFKGMQSAGSTFGSEILFLDILKYQFSKIMKFLKPS